ncbi:MAG TPA: hypothetical protein VJV79_35270 [Polyangiaceae bacterium]|nr:hypothetical protein [Polyangiaceae bacterium]
MSWARWRVLLALAVWVSWALPAFASAQNRVILLVAEGEQDLTALELVARLRGELHAAELEVIVQPVLADADLRIAVESSSLELAPAAVIGVRYLRPAPTESAGAEVWISDRLSSSTLMQVVRLNSQQADPAARLAVQVAEVLKARLALLWVKPEAPKPAPKPIPAPAPAPDRSAPVGGRFLLGLGLEFAQHSRGNVSSWLPALQLGYEPPGSSWSTPALRLSAAWTPEEATLQRPAGAAHLQQTLLLAQALLRFLPQAAVQPFISAGLGAFRVRVRGETEAPYTSSSASTWSAATTFGAGLWLQPGGAVAWLFEAQGLAAWSGTEVRVEQERIASLGFPAFLLGTSVVGRY